MQSLHLSSSASDKYATLFSGITWCFRLAIGSVFIFSGFVKDVDPWGTLYKFEEYFAALGWNLPHSVQLTGVFGLILAEFMIGICLVTGAYRRSTPWGVLAFMAIMLPLTFWIAVADPVADCGCFGDALVLSNWETFWKNVAITIPTFWLLRFNARAKCLITPSLQWLMAVCTLAFVSALFFYGYMVQPPIDFRPYPNGETLFDNESPEIEEHYIFVYERNGERLEFSEDETLPSEEDGWKFVETKSAFPVTAENLQNAKPSYKKTFRIWSADGEQDVTDNFRSSGAETLLLLSPDLGGVSPSMTWEINTLYEWAVKQNKEMAMVTAASPEVIHAWRDLSMPEYPIYTADETSIKEVARGNPALAVIKNGRIVNKMTLRSVDIDALRGPKAEEEIKTQDGQALLWGWSSVYFCAIAALIISSRLPRLLRGGYGKSGNTRQ